MISEGSCDTEDWSNDAGNSALITVLWNVTIILMFHIMTVFFKTKQMHAALVSVRDLKRPLKAFGLQTYEW